MQYPTGILAVTAVLAFFAISLEPASAQALAQFEIRATPESEDDFLCWTPTLARAKLATSGAADVAVTLKSEGAGPTAGVAGFMPAGNSIDRANYAPKKELALVLPADGSWTEFYVLGLKASDGAKDVVVRAELPDGTALGQIATMVRVRKNAEALSPRERSNFLNALAQWKRIPGLSRRTRFEDFYTAHGDAFPMGIHSDFGRMVSNFLPWHRAFLLNFERELQAVDPTVSLPYWKFDEGAPSLFSEEFLGAGVQGTNEVGFSAANPIRGWSSPAGQLLTRARSGNQMGPIDPGVLPTLACATGACPDVFRATTDSLEMNYHNFAHGFILGWLGSDTSPRDPLFFLLHANNDRGWAHWQVARDRFDVTNTNSYSPPGSYPGTVQNGIKQGLYANDEMWPWGQKTGDWGTPNDTSDDWLPYRFTFPAALGFPLSAQDYPTPAKMIDYMGVHGTPELGFCYDDIGFTGAAPSEIIGQVQ